MDPINSPYPVPWNWIQAAHRAAVEADQCQTRYYRSASLRSPDGQWVAYSRTCLEISPQLHESRVNSILFIENLQTGSLQGIHPPAPWQEPGEASQAAEEDQHSMPGRISWLIPVAWDQNGEQLLARDFEGVFCGSLASDYAVVWESTTGQSRTLAPYSAAYEYAILQGWSRNYPDQVLFKTARLGDEHQPLWRVNNQGLAMPSAQDEPALFGQTIAQELEGPHIAAA